MISAKVITMDRISIISYPGEYNEIQSCIQETSVDEIMIEIIPSTTHFLEDPKILKKVDTVVFSPLEIYSELKCARIGLPEENVPDRKYNDLCPSSLLMDDSLTQIERILDILGNNGIETIILSYRMIQPIGTSPQQLTCVCENCLQDIEDRLGIDDIKKEIQDAVVGTSQTSYDSITKELDDLAPSEIIGIQESYEETFKERKHVYNKLRHSFIKGIGDMIRDFNNEILSRIVRRGNNVRVLPGILDCYILEDKGPREYALLLGFDEGLVEDLADVFYDRSEQNGGGLAKFFDPSKIFRGAYFYTGNDEPLGQRFVQCDIDEILILPKDIEDIPEVLKNINIWSDMI